MRKSLTSIGPDTAAASPGMGSCLRVRLRRVSRDSLKPSLAQAGERGPPSHPAERRHTRGGLWLARPPAWPAGPDWPRTGYTVTSRAGGATTPLYCLGRASALNSVVYPSITFVEDFTTSRKWLCARRLARGGQRLLRGGRVRNPQHGHERRRPPPPKRPVASAPLTPAWWRAAGCPGCAGAAGGS